MCVSVRYWPNEFEIERSMHNELVLFFDEEGKVEGIFFWKLSKEIMEILMKNQSFEFKT